MPEGPEVAVLTEQLNQALSGTRIISLSLSTNLPEKFQLAENRVQGLTIERVFCYGKAIFFQLSDQSAIYNSLGMTGRWRGPLTEKHNTARVSLHTEQGIFSYSDPRMFGRLKWLNKEDMEKKLATLGPDPLHRWELTEFLQVLDSHPRCNITSLLMNQKYIAGIGNYLKAEILHAAKISPKSRVDKLTTEQKQTLFEIIKKIAYSSLQAGGYSMSDYFHLAGQKGQFRPVVYGQTDGPCGHTLKKEKTTDGRQTYWCPQCQF